MLDQTIFSFSQTFAVEYVYWDILGLESVMLEYESFDQIFLQCLFGNYCILCMV